MGKMVSDVSESQPLAAVAPELGSFGQVDNPSEVSQALVGYRIVHRTTHRIRICIPRLRNDPEYAETLRSLIKGFEGVDKVQVNAFAESIVVEYRTEISPEAVAAVEFQIVQSIQRASEVSSTAVLALNAESSDEPESEGVNVWERLGLPGLGLLLGFAAVIEVPLPALMVGAVILIAARPVYDRAFSALCRDRELSIDLLDGLAITLHTIQGNFFAPALMLGMVEGGEVIRDITARSSNRASLDLLSCLGTEAIVERDGRELHVPIDQVIVGDRVMVYPGDLIPVDGTIVRGAGLVDQCKLTGESIPVTRVKGEEVFASTILIDGHLCIVAERIGANTRAGVIANLMQSAPVHDTRVSNFATRIANQLVAPTLLLSAIVGTVSGDVSRAISLLTLDVGTGIRISVPTTVLSALTYAARNGILIRTGRTIELLCDVDVIVFDKTGTLTQGQAGVTGIKLLRSDISEAHLLTLAATAEQGLTHPVAEAIIRHARNLQLPLRPCDEWEYHVGLGVKAHIDGRTVLVGSHRMMTAWQIPIQELHHRYPDLESGPHSLVYIAIDGGLVGVILYSDPLRAESRTVVQALQARGIEVYILSGDEARIANAIADDLGIPRGNVYAEAFPERKVEVVQALHESGKTVAFCGDGINDSAALAYADVSISFAAASGIARETADVVLMDDHLTQLLQALHIAEHAMEIVTQNIVMVIVPNLSAVLAGVLFALNPVLAILINNGSAILAELNGLRPLLGPNQVAMDGFSSMMASYPAVIPSLTATDQEQSLQSERGEVQTAKDRPLLPALSAPAIQAVSLPASRLDALIQKELATRLGTSPQTISRRKQQQNFGQWSRDRDPDGVAWTYEASSRIFRPIRAKPIPVHTFPARRAGTPEAWQARRREA